MSLKYLVATVIWDLLFRVWELVVVGAKSTDLSAIHPILK